MSPTRIVTLTCTFALAGLAVGVAFERRARLKLDAENNALLVQLRATAEFTSENQRLSNLLFSANIAGVHAKGSTNINADSGSEAVELARLRKEIEQFSQRSNEVETLRADTLATSAALKETHDAHRNRRITSHNVAADDSSFQIVSASYGTQNTNLDVAAELNDRIHNGSLKMVANNSSAGGDPDFGQVKSLTVVYRSGGTLLTNQFRENEIVILPPP
jgi:hypothetical protein